MTSKSSLLITNFKVLISLLVLIIISGFFYFLGLNQNNSGVAKKLNRECMYGFLSKNEFLQTYTVKKGDTLISVAENQMGNSGRVDELIELNKEKYPHLSITNGFLEIGFPLYLPPRGINSSSGDLVAINGKLVTQDANNWTVAVEKNNGMLTYNIYPSEITNFDSKIKDDYEPGDCLTAILDSKQGNKAYIINSQ